MRTTAVLLLIVLALSLLSLPQASAKLPSVPRTAVNKQNTELLKTGDLVGKVHSMTGGEEGCPQRRPLPTTAERSSALALLPPPAANIAA